MTSRPAPNTPALTRCNYCGREHCDGRRICGSECAAALAEVRRLDLAALNHFAIRRGVAAAGSPEGNAK